MAAAPGWCGAPRPLLWGAHLQPAEGMYIRPEHEVVPLTEGDAQSPQRTLDPRPLTDTPAVGGEAPKKVQERVCGDGGGGGGWMQRPKQWRWGRQQKRRWATQRGTREPGQLIDELRPKQQDPPQQFQVSSGYSAALC